MSLKSNCSNANVGVYTNVSEIIVKTLLSLSRKVLEDRQKKIVCFANKVNMD